MTNHDESCWMFMKWDFPLGRKFGQSFVGILEQFGCFWVSLGFFGVGLGFAWGLLQVFWDYLLGEGFVRVGLSGGFQVYFRLM